LNIEATKCQYKTVFSYSCCYLLPSTRENREGAEPLPLDGSRFPLLVMLGRQMHDACKESPKFDFSYKPLV